MIPLTAVRTTARAPFAACTIASNNYLAYAKVWAESMRRHHPEAALYACIVDRPDTNVAYSELPFETIFVQQLGIPVFENFAFRYDILELNTAVKPYLLSYLRDRLGHRRAFYFDPDIWVASPMPELVEALERHPIVLTPHIAEPLDDDERPQERLLRMAGIYNLGFVGFRLDSSTEKFLAWWSERLYRHCLNDLQQGLFVDQAWMDFAPAFVDRVGILRDPRYNVAYWNLPHRQLSCQDGQWEVAQPGAGRRRRRLRTLQRSRPGPNRRRQPTPGARPTFRSTRVATVVRGLSRKDLRRRPRALSRPALRLRQFRRHTHTRSAAGPPNPPAPRPAGTSLAGSLRRASRRQLPRLPPRAAPFRARPPEPDRPRLLGRTRRPAARLPRRLWGRPGRLLAMARGRRGRPVGPGVLLPGGARSEAGGRLRRPRTDSPCPASLRRDGERDRRAPVWPTSTSRDPDRTPRGSTSPFPAPCRLSR